MNKAILIFWQLYGESNSFLKSNGNHLSGEPHKISLCWNQPQILIDLVEKAPKLTSLNLIGYEELTDLALEYISGKVGYATGLKLLNEIVLPKKCFVTPEGLRVLIENLPLLEVIENQGKMGVMLQNQHLVLPPGQNKFLLKEFSQMESITSGGLEEGDEDIDDLEGKKGFVIHAMHNYAKKTNTAASQNLVDLSFLTLVVLIRLSFKVD